MTNRITVCNCNRGDAYFRLTMTYIIDQWNLTLCAIVTVAMQFSFFLIACSCKFDKVSEQMGLILDPLLMGNYCTSIILPFWGPKILE